MHNLSRTFVSFFTLSRMVHEILLQSSIIARSHFFPPRIDFGPKGRTRSMCITTTCSVALYIGSTRLCGFSPSFPILYPLHNPSPLLTPSSTPLTNCSRTNFFGPLHEVCPTITYYIKQEVLINEAMSKRDSLFSPTKYFANNYNNSSLSELSSVFFMLCATLQCTHMRMHVYMRYILPSSRHGML